MSAPTFVLPRRRGWLMIGAIAVLGIAFVAGGGWRISNRPPAWVDVLGLVIPLTMFAIIVVWFSARKRTGLEVAPQGRAFVVTEPAQSAATAAFGLSYLAGFANSGPRLDRDLDQPWLTWLDVTLSVVIAVGTVAILVQFVRGRPTIEVRPDGLQVNGPFRGRLVPWDALTPSTRAGTLARADGGRIRLTIAANAQTAAQAVVNHYLAYPEDRPAIGTVEEYQRLQALGVLPA